MRSSAVAEGVTRRRLGPDDLPDLYAFLVRCDTAVVGQADITEEEVAADLRNPAVESYGWWDAAGRLIGHGYAERVADSDKVVLDAYVHPDHPDQDLGIEVLRFLEERGTALASAAGKASVLFDMGTYRQDALTQSWLRTRGYESPTSFVRMRIDFDGPVTEPTGEVVVRRTDRSEADLRAAYRIDEGSFGEHYGHVSVGWEHWLHRITEHGADFVEVWLAELDGEAVGLLVATTQFVTEHDAGYVRTLGVLPEARGRGVAKALLRSYFASEQRKGRAGVLLHVDVANVTGALALYESVGMRPVETIDAWAKRVPITD